MSNDGPLTTTTTPPNAGDNNDCPEEDDDGSTVNDVQQRTTASTTTDQMVDSLSPPPSSSCNNNNNKIKRFPRDWLQQLVKRHHPSFYDDGTQIDSSKTQSQNQQTQQRLLMVLAPMVDQSDLPFRLLCRRYGGIKVCYTPMIHAKLFCSDVNYRKKFTLEWGPSEDRPLIAQLCGSDIDACVKCALELQPFCDAIDINCGCPQGIAKRGNYGAFLLEQEHKILPLVEALATHLSIPVCVKVRLLPDNGEPSSNTQHSEGKGHYCPLTKKTTVNGVYNDGLTPDLTASLQLYHKLVAAGASLLTIHGRTRHNKGPLTTHADWDAIRRVVDELGQSIPIFANGSIGSTDDALQCLQITNADGIMSAEALLEYPPLFAEDEVLEEEQQQKASSQPQQKDSQPSSNNNNKQNKSTRRRRMGRVQLTREYLQLCEQYPPKKGGQGSGLKCIRMHCHRFLHADMTIHDQIRDLVIRAENEHELKAALDQLDKLHQETNHDIASEELSWYIRHQQGDGALDGDDDNENRVMNTTTGGQRRRERESTIKCVELDDDAADCFASLFSGE